MNDILIYHYYIYFYNNNILLNFVLYKFFIINLELTLNSKN